MKRATFVASVLSLALATGAMAGCGGQQAASTNEPAPAETTANDTATNGTAAGQSQEETTAQFVAALAAVPECKSVTVEEEMTTTNAKDGEKLSTKTVYKFDESGDTVKTSAEADVLGVKLVYYTDGDDAVLVTDGPVYSGTTEQFDIAYAGGLGSYLGQIIGEEGTLVECTAKIEKSEAGGMSFYSFTLDPEKYMASDEALSMLKESGSPVKEAVITIGFDEDGSIASVDKKVVYEDVTSVWNLVLSDHNKTTVDPMPEATATYEEMQEAEQMKLDQVFGEGQSADADENVTDVALNETATE